MYNPDELETNAVNAAMKSQWKEAIVLNKEILKSDKNNIDALLRLGFSYWQSGDIKNAKKQYIVALKLQPSNVTIVESLEKIKVLDSRKIKTLNNKVVNLNPYLFLEIPGKTKTVTLINPGQKNILAGLTIGQEVMILPKKRKIEIRTKAKEFIGSLPDDISKRMTIFIKAGSVISAYIKEAGLKNVIIFLKEEKKGKKVMKYSSFPTNFQANISEMTEAADEAMGEEETEDLTENDLDKLAEALAIEEKEYLPYEHEEQEEETEE